MTRIIAMARIPEKLFFKIGEVCELTETQPYVLRFWESEFPQLEPRKNRSGQRIYSSEDIEVVQSIKRLLYDEGYTIAGARKRLDNGNVEPAPARTTKEATGKASKSAAQAKNLAAEVVPAPVKESQDSPTDYAESVRKLRAVLALMDETDRKLR